MRSASGSPGGTAPPRAGSARWAALALAATACVTVLGTGDGPPVESLRIEGARAVHASDIERRLATQGPHRRWLVLVDKTRLDSDALASDRRRIERYYQDHGYYSAQVEDVQVTPRGGGVAVTFRVSEGQPTRVSEVKVEGLEAAPAAPRPKLPIAQGDVFTVEAYDAARADLTSSLHDSGYARAEVAQHATVEPSRREAQVAYDVHPGERYRLGSVFVAGTSQVPRARVREEAELVLTPGAPFDERLLAKAQSRVFDMGVFGGVRVTQGTPDEARGTIPVVIAVREAPFRTIRVGPGIGFEATRWEVHAVAGWTDRNFLGGLRKLTLDGRVGYAWLPTPFAANPRSGIVGALTAELVQPRPLDARWVDLDVRAQVERGLEPAYAFTAERARFGLPLRLGHVWTVVPSYNLELYQVQPVAAATALPNLPSSETNLLLVQGCPGNVCLLSYLEQRLAWDGRNDPIETRSGAYVGISVQEGFRIGSRGFRYLRLLPEARGFVPLSEDVVLAARVRYGNLIPLGSDPRLPEDQQTPIVVRFLGGGPSSMRGYYTRRFGPMLDAIQSVDASGNAIHTLVPIGGDGLLDGTLELRHGITDHLGGAAFVDFGNVTRRAADALRLEDLQYAVGYGLRYATPFGPVRVDVAVRLPTRQAGTWTQPALPVLQIDPSGRLSPVRDASGNAVLHHEHYFVTVNLSLGEAF